MPLTISDYLDAKVEVDDETEGGDTYYINGRSRCYAYTSSHRRAVLALTNNLTNKMKKLKQSVVDRLVEREKISLDTSECTVDSGWLGTRVFDEIGDFIGEVGARCSKSAGSGTIHKGTGRCVWHDGAKSAAKIRTGKYAKVSKKSIQEKIEMFVTDKDPTNLIQELSTQRAMMQMMLEWVADEADAESIPGIIEKVIKLNDVIGRQAERISTIDQRHALTAGQVLYLQTVVIDILKTYVEDPRKLERATYDLANRLGFSIAQNKNVLSVNTDW